jgi:hypothetical protein
MYKPVIAAAALLVIAGSSFVYAQQGFGGHDGFGGRGFNADGQRAEFRHRPSAADVAAFTDARIAAMKAGLELTPDQAKNWPAFEQAVRDMAQLRIDRIKAREAQGQQQSQQQSQQQAQPPMSPFDRLSRRADNMAKRSAALKKVADAGAPLYQSLDDAQKSRFTVLAHMLRPHHPGFQGWRRFGEGDGRGFGGPGFGRGGRMLDQDKGGGRMQNLGDDGDQGSRL